MSLYPAVLSEEKTIRLALAGRSISRFGDGELKICRGGRAKSQDHDPQLSKILRTILKDTDGPCLPCIPRVEPRGPKAKFWDNYEGPPYRWFYRQGGVYGSAFVTRPDSAPEIDRPDYWGLVRGLWRYRDVILIRGSKKSLTPERLLGAASVEDVIAPHSNAWNEHKAILERLRGESRRVILCLGATATALAWILAQEGIHALDLGHIGMYMRRIGEDGTVGARRSEKD